jgi:mono/diheme cytochrome c family protein
MTRYIALIVTVLVAACGSKSSSTPTTAAMPAHDDADHDHKAAGAAAATSEPTSEMRDRSSEPAKPDQAAVKPELLASERSAWAAAKPVFDKSCATCHTKDGKKSAKKKLDHFNMDTYPPGGHHTGTIGFTIRDVLGITGKKPAMPFDTPGSVQGEDLAKIKAWTDAWEVADEAGAHPPAASDKDND